MIMIISIIYIFLYLMWYLINSLKLVSENPKIPPWKNPLPLFTQSASPLFLPTLKIFQAPRQKAGGGWGGRGGGSVGMYGLLYILTYAL